ncbi:MAG: hypothetical protein ABI409_17560, partial [Ramlibacter sp.]
MVPMAAFAAIAPVVSATPAPSASQRLQRLVFMLFSPNSLMSPSVLEAFRELDHRLVDGGAQGHVQALLVLLLELRVR